MTALDTNVLVFAHRGELPKHKKANALIARLAEGADPWGIPVFCIGEFVRVVTNRRVFSPPSTIEEACGYLERVLASPSFQLLLPGPGFPEIFMRAAREGDTTGNLAFDAQIVAVCREAGVQALVTDDRDFARFPGFHAVPV